MIVKTWVLLFTVFSTTKMCKCPIFFLHFHHYRGQMIGSQMRRKTVGTNKYEFSRLIDWHGKSKGSNYSICIYIAKITLRACWCCWRSVHDLIFMFWKSREKSIFTLRFIYKVACMQEELCGIQMDQQCRKHYSEIVHYFCNNIEIAVLEINASW